MKVIQRNILFILVSFYSFVAIAQTTTPNILLVIADDIGVGEIPNYAPDVIKANMPHLEALMQQGLTFDNVWSNPVCAPSRANILTGKYGFRTNVLNAESLSTLDTEETSLHEYIAEASNGVYSNSLIGKWHLGGAGANPTYDYPNQLGIDYFSGIMGGGVQDYNSYDFVQNGQGSETTDYITTKLTDTAIDWINTQNQPWFCWLAYNTAHTPLHLPPLEMHTQGDLPTDEASIEDNPQPYFLAMIESLDYDLGRLMDNIPTEDLTNTVIIFIGDNGTSRNVIQSPYTMNKSKGSLYQGGVHVPMVLSGAGVSRVNERESALISFSDLFSTIVELTGTSLPQIHDSYSFASLLSEAGTAPRDCAYTEVEGDEDSSGWASRDETFKYISFDSGAERFYNLINDPYETNNLLPNLNNNQQEHFDKLSMVRSNLTTATEDLTVERDFDIFPNPAHTLLYLDWKKNTAEEAFIFDVSGKLVQTEDLSFGQNALHIGDLKAGTYFIQIGERTTRFVKM